MDQWEQSPVGTALGTMVGQLSPRPITDDTLFVSNVLEFLVHFLVVTLVVSTIENSCTERLISELTSYTSSWM